ncbi:hypothetical protein ACN2MM_12740 [Alkalilimnicola ehrlichii MLHE-1]|uniref:Uncharacterized protein n=1 Tax=Alkalilimnicola ehrlichii (strain ATCC BAA-1101 / DSM 17681 / MLHE-1) TaxID=187272 RepID=Q0A602_ALKEH|nr:hypothetical protein [Alkalilimnicola ehrlichii]ABI57735.1 hypothetical protein Mlg_2395 [Alkalilimnicola ehrlichii MLHE-1]
MAVTMCLITPTDPNRLHRFPDRGWCVGLALGVMLGLVAAVGLPVAPVHADGGVPGAAFVYMARIEGGLGGRHTDGHTVRLDAAGRLQTAHYRTDGALPEVRSGRIAPARFHALSQYLTGDHTLARPEADGPISDFRPTRLYFAYRSPAGKRFIGSGEPEALPEALAALADALQVLTAEVSLTEQPEGHYLQFLPAPEGARRSPQVAVSADTLADHPELQEAEANPGRFVPLAPCGTDDLAGLGIEPGRAYRAAVGEASGLVQIFQRH